MISQLVEGVLYKEYSDMVYDDGEMCVCVFVFFCFKKKTEYEILYGLVGSEMFISDRSSSAYLAQVGVLYMARS